MALKSFKRVFDSNQPYLVLTIDGEKKGYDKLTIINSEKEEIKAEKLGDAEAANVRTRLKASATDLIYNLYEINGCNDRKKGFRFKDPDGGREVYLNASNTIIYGNVEVLGVDIKALYISADKRLIGKGDVDSSRIKNESIQSALEFANIDGLKGELGCDANGAENYNLYYLNLQNKVAKEEVEQAKTIWEDADKAAQAAAETTKAIAIAERDKSLKKYFSIAKAYLRNAEEDKIADNITDAKTHVKTADNEIIKNNLQHEDSFMESLGIRFKQASLIHYEAQDVNKDFNGLLKELKDKIKENSQLLLPGTN